MSRAPQDMLTKDEAVEFLQNSWKVKNVLTRMKDDRKNLVDEIVTLILGKVPFQSISVMAATPEERKLPSCEDMKETCMSGVGGLCYQMNIFAWGLLKALGFTVHMLLATVTSTVTASENHVIVLVSGLQQEGDLYLVDCGTGYPIFRAVSLDFSEESPIFNDGFLEYKYVRHDGKILRMHGKGDMVNPNNPPVEGLDFFLGRWRRFYSFVPSTKQPDAFREEYYKAIIGLTPFTSSPRAVWFPGKRAVAIANNKLIVENEAGEMVTTIFKSDEEIMKAYRVHFPQLKQDAVKRALAEWRRVSKYKNTSK